MIYKLHLSIVSKIKKWKKAIEKSFLALDSFFIFLIEINNVKINFLKNVFLVSNIKLLDQIDSTESKSIQYNRLLGIVFFFKDEKLEYLPAENKHS